MFSVLGCQFSVFRSILRTVVRREVGSREREDGSFATNARIIEIPIFEIPKSKIQWYTKDNFGAKKFCNDHWIWQASIKKGKLP